MLMWDFQPVLFRVGGLKGLKVDLELTMLSSSSRLAGSSSVFQNRLPGKTQRGLQVAGYSGSHSWQEIPPH